MAEKSFLICVDFLGAGNLGDDLMVSGFLEGLKALGLNTEKHRVRAICSHDRESQMRRFPGIEWIDGRDAGLYKAAIEGADALLGIGGTIFQMAIGDWLLRDVERAIAARKAGTPFMLVNTGGESEAGSARERCRGIMAQMKRISTRDKFTYELLEGWRNGDKAPELIEGADLANITLPNLCATHRPLAERPREIALILGADTLKPSDVRAAVDWVASKDRCTAWIACEVRNMKGCEYRIYLENWFRFGNIFTRWWKPRIHLMRPKYHSCSMEELVEPFSECRTVLSSRYHGILSAAWSGCRVAGIARSSKVKWLCAQLDIPVLHPPVTPEGLDGLEPQARPANLARLESLRDLAVQGMKGLGLDEA